MTIDRLHQAATGVFIGQMLEMTAFITAIWASSTGATVTATILFCLGALFTFAGFATLVEERKETIREAMTSLGYDDTQVRP